MLPSSEVFAEAIGDGGDNLADRPDTGVENRNEGLFVWLLSLDCIGWVEAGLSEVSSDLFTKTCTGDNHPFF